MGQTFRNQSTTIIGTLMLITLIFVSIDNFLLFHSLAEILSIVIATSFFMLAWNARDIIKDHYLLFLSIAYLFVAILDVFHTLSYKGINIFNDYDHYSSQLWVAARFLQALSILIGFGIFKFGWRLNHSLLLWSYFFTTSGILASIFVWRIFPECFIEGVGLTPFKIISEYVIIFLLIISILILFYYKSKFENNIFRLLCFSISFTILSEACFTIYVNVYDVFNITGHILKIIAYFLLYRAVIVTGLKEPFAWMFRELKQREDELSDLNKAKDKLFSVIAHDLKNPVNYFIGITELLNRNYNSIDENKKKELFKQLNHSSKNTFYLLENLLQWYTNQTKGLEPEPAKIDIVKLARENIELMKYNAEAKNIELIEELKENVFAFADSNMISTIIRNLIANAIKFTPASGRVIIRAATTSNEVVCSVVDNGVGISEENLQKLWQKEENFSSQGTAKEKGIGLGLTLCREFIEKNNGELSIKSSLGNGSTFSFTLPLFDEQY